MARGLLALIKFSAVFTLSDARAFLMRDSNDSLAVARVVAVAAAIVGVAFDVFLGVFGAFAIFDADALATICLGR